MSGARADEASETFVGADALGLSEEEIEGLDYDEDEVSQGHGVDDDEPSETGEGDRTRDDDDDEPGAGEDDNARGKPADDPQPPDTDTATKTGDDEPGGEPGPEPEPEPDQDGAPAPSEPAPDPLKAIDDDLKATRAQRKELSQKWADGELNDSDFDAQRAELDEKVAELVGRRAYHQENQKETESRRKQDFQVAVSTFFGKEANKKFYSDGSPEWYALDGLFQALQSDPKHQGSSYQDLLTEADKQIRKRFGSDTPGKPEKPKTTTKPPEAPPSVADAPAAEGNDSEFREFEDLEDLLDTDIQAYEEALAKMPADKRAAYDAWVERI